MSISVVIVDDHPIVLSGLRSLFANEDDIDIKAECLNGAQALEAVEAFSPDVLLLDLMMEQRKDGLDVLRKLREQNDPTYVVMLTAALDDDDILETIRLGARGVILKEMAPQMLVQCVRKVAAGGEWMEKNATNRALQRLLEQQDTAKKLSGMLTARQIEIIQHVADGKQNKQIAAKLHITEGTVKVHLHTIYEKLSISGRVELVKFAQDHDLT